MGKIKSLEDVLKLFPAYSYSSEKDAYLCQAPGHSGSDRSVMVLQRENRIIISSLSDPTEVILQNIGLKKTDLILERPKDYSGKLQIRFIDRHGIRIIKEGTKYEESVKTLFLDIERLKPRDPQEHDSDLIQTNLRKLISVETMNAAGVKINGQPGDFNYGMLFPYGQLEHNPHRRQEYVIVEGRTDYLSAIEMGVDRHYGLISRFNKTMKIIPPDDAEKVFIILDKDDKPEHINFKWNEVRDFYYVNVPYPARNKDLSDWLYNDRPHLEDLELLLSKASFFLSLGLPAETLFWDVQEERVKSKLRTKIRIIESNMLNYLEWQGYHKIRTSPESIQLLHIDDYKVEEVNASHISNHMANKIKNLPPLIYKREFINSQGEPDEISVHKKALLEIYTKDVKKLTQTEKLELLKEVELDLLTDTQNEIYFYFKNRIIKICPDKIEEMRYAAIDKHIWKKQIIDFQIELDKHWPLKKCYYTDFLKLICTARKGEGLEYNEDKFQSFKAVTGYLLSRYKNKALIPAIYLVDEDLNDLGLREGRRGKGLFMQFLQKMRRVATLDGGDFDFSDQFKYSTVEITDNIIFIDDVTPKFADDNLFSAISETLIINAKNKNRVVLPFDKSPKFVVSSNYPPRGNSGSHRDRRFEIEFSNYFGLNHKPTQEFGTGFYFENWSKEHYNTFYNCIFSYCQYFLQKGLVNYNKDGLELSKLKVNTHPDFVEYAEELQQNIWLSLGKTRTDIIEKYYDVKVLKFKTLTTQRLRQWLALYCEYKGLHLLTRKKYFSGSSGSKQEWAFCLSDGKTEPVHISSFEDSF